jgi:hypothetical protein
MKYLIIFLLFTTSAFSQFYSNLKGMEDNSGNTHLFYRILIENDSSTSNSIYHLDVASDSETLFLLDTDSGGVKNIINDFEFWNKDPQKFIYSRTIINNGTTTEIFKYTGEVLFSVNGAGGNIELSHQDSNLIFIEAGSYIYKTTNGGQNWIRLRYGKLSSVSPFDHNIVYSQGNDSLFKSIDKGENFYLTDVYSEQGTTEAFYYDKNGMHIYKLTLFDEGFYYRIKKNLFISTNNGEPYSWNLWQNGYYYDGIEHLAVDTSISGKIYFVFEPTPWSYPLEFFIRVSYDYGGSVTITDTLPNSITGIYIKPGSDIKYAATSRDLYEIKPTGKTILRHLELNPAIYDYYPLENGMKWVYNYSSWDYGGWPPNWEYYDYSREVIGDTLMPDGFVYKIIHEVGPYPYNRYERLDKTDGTVKQFSPYDSSSQIIQQLWLGPRETAWLDFGPVQFFASYDVDKFNVTTTARVYLNDVVDNARYYTLLKNIGMDTTKYSFYGGNALSYLKGMVKDGIVYGDTTLLDVNDEVPVPASFTLYQNYPNPFNPSTKIKFYLPERSFVTLKVFDILGNEIRTLLNEERELGEHQVLFNAAELSAGVYFYNIRTSGFSETKKMLLLK